MFVSYVLLFVCICVCVFAPRINGLTLMAAL